MFVRGLPWRADEYQVREYFAQCGEIISCDLPLQHDGRSSGTAIIEFSTKEACEACVALNGEDFDGRWLSIQYSTNKPVGVRQTSEKPEGCNTVFVGNLSFNIDEDTLRQAFAECGEIEEIRFAEDRETGEFKGFGHIQFSNTESTDLAIKMAGQDIAGRPVRVDFAADKRNNGGGRGGGRGFGRGRGGGRGGDGGYGRGRGARGGGRGGSNGGNYSPKKTGGIAEFKGNKITFD